MKVKLHLCDVIKAPTEAYSLGMNSDKDKLVQALFCECLLASSFGSQFVFTSISHEIQSCMTAERRDMGE